MPYTELERGLLLAVRRNRLRPRRRRPTAIWCQPRSARSAASRRVRVMKTASLVAGDATPVKQFDFGTAIPSNFVFSPDGQYLFGSSYYTGRLQHLPLRAGDRRDRGADQRRDRVLPPGAAGRRLAAGVPLHRRRVRARRSSTPQPVKDVNAITFFGQQVVEKHPVLKQWAAGSPGSVPIESMITRNAAVQPAETTRPGVDLSGRRRATRMSSRTARTCGSPIRLSLNGASVTASFSPAATLPRSERGAPARRLPPVTTGPATPPGTTRTSTICSARPRRAAAATTSARPHEAPALRRAAPPDATIDGSVAGNLDQLPEYQNVPVRVDRLFSLVGDLSYTNVRSSLGNVDDEKGHRWSVVMHNDVGRTLAAVHAGCTGPTISGLRAADRALLDLDSQRRRVLAAGRARAVRELLLRRVRQQLRRPSGRAALSRVLCAARAPELNEVGGRNFGKSTVEWNLPPRALSRVPARRGSISRGCGPPCSPAAW